MPEGTVDEARAVAIQLRLAVARLRASYAVIVAAERERPPTEPHPLERAAELHPPSRNRQTRIA